MVRLKFKKVQRALHATVDKFHIVKLSPVADIQYIQAQIQIFFFGKGKSFTPQSKKKSSPRFPEKQIKNNNKNNDGGVLFSKGEDVQSHFYSLQYIVLFK